MAAISIYDFGLEKHKVIDSAGTASYSANSDEYIYAIIPVHGACTFSATADLNTSDDLPSGATAEGVVVYGRFSAVTSTSGKAIVYIRTIGE